MQFIQSIKFINLLKNISNVDYNFKGLKIPMN